MTVGERAGADAPAWAEWAETASYSVGAEEEVMVLDPGHDWALAPRLEELMPTLSPQMARQMTRETQDAVLELATRPHRSAEATAAEAAILRGRLTAELAPLGLRAASAGTHPCAVWNDTRISSGDRHQEVYGSMRELARREPTFGLHVHVGVADAESAILLYNRLRSHLPLLLALSANSPFWQGRDTGLASVRTPIFQAFPRVGTPRPFSGYDEYVDTVDRLLRCQAFPDPTYLWWDVRPQPRFGTVEIRIMDAQSESRDTHALIALVQAIAHLELEEGYHVGPLVGSPEIVAENRFIAARDGANARLIDPVRETQVSVTEALEDLLAVAEPHARALHIDGALDDARRLAADPGSDRQRRAAAASGPPTAVIRWLAEVF